MGKLLKNRAFIFLWLGQAAAGLGGTFSTFIMSWLVYELTGSLVAMSSTWVAMFTPSLMVQLWSGPYLDRWNRKKVMVVSEWLRAAAFLIPTVLLAAGQLQVWHLYLTAVIIGIAEPLFRPSSMAIVAEILPKDRLNQGNSFLEGTMQIMFLIGPPLGGIILQWMGAQAVLLVLVATMSGAGVLLLFLPKQQIRSSGIKETWLKQFKAGLNFYQVNPVLLGMGLLLMVCNFANGATSPMFLPYVTEILGGSAFQYGLFTSSFSIGMLLGSLVTGTRQEPKDRRKVILRAMLGIGVFMALLGTASSFPLAVLFVAGSGFSVIMINVNNTTMYQRKVPDEIRGRVFTVRILLAQAGMPLGAIAGGALAESWGIPSLFHFMGGVIILATALAFVLPVFYQLNDNKLSLSQE